MKTDRELLELAAKAVGGELSPGHAKRRTGETWGEWEWIGPVGIVAPCFNGVGYPLTNDGDALRLAAKLKIDLEWDTDEDSVYARDSAAPFCYRRRNAIDYKLAIVDVAADMQEQKEKQCQA